jgi:hypothetical protein
MGPAAPRKRRDDGLLGQLVEMLGDESLDSVIQLISV